MTRRILISFILCVCTLAAFAIPAKRIPFNVKLENGKSITIFKAGDESYHFWTTTDGTPVVKVSEGVYRLAPELKDSITAKWTERSKIRNAHRLERAQKVSAQSKVRKAFGYPSTYTGSKKGIVLLVNFSDKPLKSTSTKEAFSAQFNDTGYNKNGHIGSVHDYFFSASYGKFDLTFDVYGPVTVTRPMAYYGANDAAGDDKHPGELVIEACRRADDTYNINWKNYDWDKDGFVDQVYIIYAGYGENATDVDSQIWPHESSLTDEKSIGDGSGPLSVGGVKVDTYAVSCELTGSSGSTIDGIGTACHEFSHCLGIPDFYDTSYSGGFGMNAWDLMDGGSYSGPTYNGEVPTGYSAYERWFAGWLDFTELKEPCFIENMPSIEDSPTAYIIYNDNNKNEYFILENRQSKGWFKYVTDYTNIHGMLAYHVDYDENAWVEDIVNNSSKHQRMCIIPAGKSYGTYYSDYGSYYPTEKDFASQLFPGTKSATELTNTSHEKFNGKLFNKNTDGSYYMNKPITDISESGGLISFTFMGGKDVETPVAKDATLVGSGSFTANWRAATGADSYTLEVTPISNATSSLILAEDMSKLASVTTDETTAIKSFNDYMVNSGWKGSTAFGAPSSIKIGSSKYTGSLTSPTLDAPNSGNVTVSINTKIYGNDNTKLSVSILDASGSEIKSNTFTPTSTAEDYAFTFEDITSNFSIKIASEGTKQRAYIYGIYIYDGNSASSAKLHKAPTKLTFEGITATRYTVTDLTETSYKYRVKGVSGKASSGWSEYIIVEGVNESTTPEPEPEDPEPIVDPEEPEDPDPIIDPEEPEDPDPIVDPEEPEDPEPIVDPEEPEDPEPIVDPEPEPEPEEPEDPEPEPEPEPEPSSVATVGNSDASVEYYTLKGNRIKKPTTPGIYLVKKAGKVQKMLISR